MRLSLATKIFIAFALLVAIFTGVLMFGVYRTQTLFNQIERINRRIVPVSLKLSDAQTDLKSFNVLLNERDPLVVRRTLQVARLVHSLPDRIHKRVSRAVDVLEAEEDDEIFGESQTRRLSGLSADLRRLEERADRFAGRARNFTVKVLREPPGQWNETRIDNLQGRLRDDVRQLDERITVLRTELRAMTNRGLQRANENEQSSLWALGIMSGAALLFSVAVLFAIVRIIRPLTDLTEATRRIGEGDYRPLEEMPTPWLGADEITLLAREFNSMAEKLAERDAKLREQHEALLKSERLATVGRMTSVITHELRNPLSSINLNAEMLMDGLVERGVDPQDPEVMPLLETIIDEVDRLRDITEEYLVYARLPSADLETAELTEIVRNLVDFHLGEWQMHGVEVRLEMPDKDVAIEADPDHLRQALLNIVKNAIEASDDGQKVEVSVDTDDEVAAVAIRDHGPGLDTDEPESIFEPFYTTKPDGTGLGLAMTQQIIDEHHGRIRVEQPDGEDGGTRFVIEIPRGGAES